MAFGPITSWQIDGKTMETVTDFIFLGSQITENNDSSHAIKRRLLLGRKAITNLDSVKKQRHHFADKSLSSQRYDFSSNHVWMWEVDHKEGWTPKNLCFQIVVLEKTLESPLDCKDIQPVNSKGNQSWIFIGRTDAEAKAPTLWPFDLIRRNDSFDLKKWLIWKDPDAGKDWRQKGMTEDEMIGWHHRLSGHEFEQALGDGEGQGSLVCRLQVTESQTWLSNLTATAK